MTRPFNAWVRFEWTHPFIWKRFAGMLVMSLLPSAACLALGQGVLGLMLMAVGIWPFPLRLSVREAEITCRWLFVRQTISFAEVTSARVIQDPRRWTFCRRSVLALGRRHRGDLLVFAKEPALTRIEQAFQQWHAVSAVEVRS